jgi:ribonucleoside-diphosphate reductase alpha chain
MPSAPGTRSRWAPSTARNAQAAIAPTGTIGLVMDCDTTGIDDFALVVQLAGGGYFKIINRAVPEALRLGHGVADIAEIEAYAVGHGTMSNAPAINHTTLKVKGFMAEAVRRWRRRC